jgi:hypothetical protein
MTDWAKLYRDLQILDTPTPRIQPPSDADLDRFERGFSFRLPLDYRAFIKVFGPGQLTHDYRFRSTGCSIITTGEAPRQFNEHVDLTALNEALRKVQASQDAMDGPYTPQARRLVYFVDNTAGDYVGWDSLDVRDKTTVEYGVYMVPREDGGARRLADTFAAFVERECLDDAARPKYWAFQPASQYSGATS